MTGATAYYPLKVVGFDSLCLFEWCAQVYLFAQA
jgi:hypothetical protein